MTTAADYFRRRFHCDHGVDGGVKQLICNEPGCWEAEGLSSRLIESEMLNITICSIRYSRKPRGLDCIAIPHDSADFGRCVKLLDAHPDWKPRLVEMAKHGYVWERLVRSWQNLEDRLQAGDLTLSYEIKTMTPVLNRLRTIDDLGPEFESCDPFVVASILPQPPDQHCKFHLMEMAVLPKGTRVRCWDNPNGDNLPPTSDPHVDPDDPDRKNDPAAARVLKQLTGEVILTEAAGLALHGCPCFRLVGPSRLGDKLHWLCYWSDEASADEVALVLMPEGREPPRHPKVGDDHSFQFITCKPVEVNLAYEDGLNNA
jgi:hypothetical protein